MLDNNSDKSELKMYVAGRPSRAKVLTIRLGQHEPLLLTRDARQNAIDNNDQSKLHTT